MKIVQSVINTNDIFVGVGWFNDDCSKIIIEFYKSVKNAWNGGIVNGNSGLDEKGELVSVMKHGKYINKHKKKFFNDVYPDFLKAKTEKNARYGYPRFRIWYSEKNKFFRLNLPLELRDKDISKWLDYFKSKCNFQENKQEFRVSFDKQFYKWTNEERFRNMKFIDGVFLKKYNVFYDPEILDWDSFAIEIGD